MQNVVGTTAIIYTFQKSKINICLEKLHIFDVYLAEVRLRSLYH